MSIGDGDRWVIGDRKGWPYQTTPNNDLTTAWVLGQFGRQLKTCRKNYISFALEGYTDKEEQRKEFYAGEHDPRVLGDERFLEKVLNQSPSPPQKTLSLDKLVDTVCSRCAITKNELTGISRNQRLSEARGVIGWLAAEKTSATLTEVANLLNRDPANISRAAKKVRENKPEIKKLINLQKDK